MSYTPFEGLMPDVMSQLTTAVSDLSAILKQLQSMGAITSTSSSSSSGGGYPAVFALPTNYSNLIEIIVAGQQATAYTSSDYVVVPANESATLTIDVNPNTVLVFAGASGIYDTAYPHDSGFLESITIDGVDIVSDKAMLDDIALDGAFVAPAQQTVVFTYDNTTSSSITGQYDVQGASLNVSVWKNYLLPTLMAQAQQLLKDGSSLLP